MDVRFTERMMRMKWKERPCNYCRMSAACPGVDCRRWQVWFLEAWEGFNQKALAERHKQNHIPGDKLLYGLPHEGVDPCKNCPIGDWCHSPCGLRLWWWDRTMEKIGRRMQDAKR